MEDILLAVMYVSLIIILYTYIGYPIALWLLEKIIPAAKVHKKNIFPKVTLIISCYNEEKVLHEKLQNSLNLDYPKELLEVLVVSDGSSDQTDDIARGYHDQGVELIRQEGRLGKTMGLNLAVSQATGEIIVFSDANAMYQPDAVRQLVENFADVTVGYVVGEAQYAAPDQTAASSNENSYWNYEIYVKKLESNLHSVVGGDGAIYAIRKELYEQLRQTDINDFVNPLQIIAKGYRGIYEPLAIAMEGAAGSFTKEFNRKTRIVNRAFTGLLRVKEVMNPFKTGFFSFQIISHKLLRWLIPFFLLSFGISSICLAFSGIFLGQLLVALILVAVAFVLLGWWGQHRGRPWPSVLFFPYYFSIVNVAALCGVYKSIRGDVQVTWETVRSETTAQITHNKTVVVSFSLAVLFVTACLMIINFYAGGTVAVSFLFWLSFSTICYVYFGYPFVLYLWSKLVPGKPIHKDTIRPTVTLLVCAYNEEDVIQEKIENTFALDYPADKLTFVIASDGSTDQTSQIVSRHKTEGVILYDYQQRRGKIGAMLAAIPNISSEIVVFSDANTMYAGDALIKLVRNFADPSVGAVSGDVILQNEETSFGSSESSYYVYERWIQQAESQLGSIVGADGAMYAIRRDLFVQPSVKTILDDFVISMNIALQGYRVVYDGEARGYEKNTISFRAEFIRKSRVVAGAVQSILLGQGQPSFRQPVLLYCYFSHKLLRWIAPCLLIMCLVTNLVLVFHAVGFYYGGLLTLQIGFYFLALVGCLLRRQLVGKLLSFPFYFCLVNGAALYGLYKGALNMQDVAWETFARKRTNV